MFYLKLQKAIDIKRDEDGLPYSWRATDTIADFTDPEAFALYVEDNVSDLSEAVCFTGSASLIMRANAFLTTELKKAKVIV